MLIKFLFFFFFKFNRKYLHTPNLFVFSVDILRPSATNQQEVPRKETKAEKEECLCPPLRISVNCYELSGTAMS